MPGGRRRRFRNDDGHARRAVVPPPLLLIVGGGHVGQRARQASLLDFEVVLIEDRSEFSDPARFPANVTVRCGDVAEQLKQFPLNADTYVALVSAATA